MIKQKWVSLMASLLGIVLIVSCAKKGVICSKGAPEEVQGYQGLIVLGTKEKSKIRDSLCGEDIDKILLLITALNPFQKNRLKELVCGPTATENGFLNFFTSLNDEAKADVIRAFATYSYYIHGYG